MGILSRLFNLSERQEIRRIVQRAHDEVEETLRPLDSLALEIIKAAHDCAQQTDSVITFPDQRANMEARALVFYEFLFFFMHLTTRSGLSQLTKEETEKIHDFLGPAISSVAVDSFRAHWPKDVKRSIAREFCENWFSAELEYSRCEGFYSDAHRFASNTLVSTLGRNVAELSGNPMNPMVIQRVMSVVIGTYVRLDLDSLVRNARAVLYEEVYETALLFMSSKG